MSKPRDDRQAEMFRPALEQIIDLEHPLVRLSAVDMPRRHRARGLKLRSHAG